MAALSLYDAVDSPSVSENSVVLAALGLNPELSEAWTRHGLNFEQQEDSDVPHSSADRADQDLPEEMELQLWALTLSYSLDARKTAGLIEDPDQSRPCYATRQLDTLGMLASHVPTALQTHSLCCKPDML
eukprot:1563019-Rhodomonas_salina.1